MEKVIVYKDRGSYSNRVGLFNEKTSEKIAEAWHKHETYTTCSPEVSQLYKTKTGKYVIVERENIRPFFWWKEWKIGKIERVYLISKERAIEFYNYSDPCYKRMVDYPELYLTSGLKEV